MMKYGQYYIAQWLAGRLKDIIWLAKRQSADDNFILLYATNVKSTMLVTAARDKMCQ